MNARDLTQKAAAGSFILAVASWANALVLQKNPEDLQVSMIAANAFSCLAVFFMLRALHLEVQALHKPAR